MQAQIPLRRSFPANPLGRGCTSHLRTLQSPPSPSVSSVLLRNPTRGAPKAKGISRASSLAAGRSLASLCLHTGIKGSLGSIPDSWQGAPKPLWSHTALRGFPGFRGLAVAASRPLSQEGKAEHWEHWEHWDQVQYVYRCLLTAPLP